jgi:NAD(P)-dependent dehydrogenase (short-subunit alcohol dehydrogenase family)
VISRAQIVSANLAGKTALITGASGGLGAHFAHVLARCGCHVAIGARRAGAREQLVAEITSAGGRACHVELDVTDSRSVADAVEHAERMLGTIDVLVNNSGISRMGALLELPEQDWDAVMGTNLKGAYLVSVEVARRMRQAGCGGSIVNIGSVLGMRQAKQVAAYAVSKAGLIQLTKLMALEFARDNIRVNALSPGYFDTDMNHELWTTPAGEALVKRIPQRRLGAVEDLDGALLLLASESSRFMTGSVIVVDGGHLVSSL